MYAMRNIPIFVICAFLMGMGTHRSLGQDYSLSIVEFPREMPAGNAALITVGVNNITNRDITVPRSLFYGIRIRIASHINNGVGTWYSHPDATIGFNGDIKIAPSKSRHLTFVIYSRSGEDGHSLVFHSKGDYSGGAELNGHTSDLVTVTVHKAEHEFPLLDENSSRAIESCMAIFFPGTLLTLE